MSNKNLILIITAGVVIIAGIFLLNQQYKFFTFTGGIAKAPEGIILFFGDGCPHCKIVSDFIKANNVASKVKFTELEVFNNQNNAKILAQKAQVCKIDQSQIGVPFLWDGKTCIVGDQDVIKFFQNQLNAKK